MTVLSEAFWRFEDRLKEVYHLESIARRYSNIRTIIKGRDKAEHANALVRAGTVLLSSHLQGYVEDISDVVIDRLVQGAVPAEKVPDSLRYHATRSTIKRIQEFSDPAKIIQEIRTYSQNYNKILDTSGAVSDGYIGSEYKDGFGNPTTKEIKKFVARFGISNFNSEMGKKLKSEWPIVENAVNQIVDRRNKIAHGDSQATLTVNEFRDYVKLSRKFISAADRVVTSHFRIQGCKF